LRMTKLVDSYTFNFLCALCASVVKTNLEMGLLEAG
jgi:hypothetical protein